MTANRPKRRDRVLATGLAVTVLGAGLLAGCGGGSGADATNANATVGDSGGGNGRIVESHDAVSQNGGATQIETGRYPTGRDTDEESSSGTKPIKPCSLVTRREASQILGGSASSSEHPQGPTCVYSSEGREITMAVMEVPLRPLVSGAGKSKPLTIGGRRAYCIRYEKSSVVTSIARGRILQVTGPCQADVRFVAIALGRLG